MPLTVGEWQDILRQRKNLSRLWAIKTSHPEAILKVIEDISSEGQGLYFVSACPSYVLEPYPPLFELLRRLQKETKNRKPQNFSQKVVSIISIEVSLRASMRER